MNRLSHNRGQRGSSLVLVLGLVATMSIVIPALLTMIGTGLLVTSPVVKDRAEVYAATSGLEAAITNGRYDASVGAQGAPCNAMTLKVNGFDVTISCAGPSLSTDGCHYLDRFATFTAQVRAAGESKVLFTSSADIAYRFSPTGAPKVEVRQFASHANGPVTTQPFTTCSGTSPTTTTSTTSTTSTTTSTTSTTTTTLPTVTMAASWTDPAAEVPPVTSNKTWRAAATVNVKDPNGVAVTGADVAVQVKYLKRGTWYTEATQLVGRTTSAGTFRFTSAEYPTNGQSVDQVQFVITSVAKSGYGWTSPVPATSISISN